MHTKLRSTKIIFIDRRALIYRESFLQYFHIILCNQQCKQKNDKSWKKNSSTSSKSTEESIVNQNSLEYWIFCILQTFVKQEK